VDLDNADLHDGQVPWYLGKDFDGITRGNDIYFRPGYYDADTAAGIALLGHELVHVGQYRNGMNWLTYLWSTRHGYMKSPYEQAAYATQAQINNDLNGTLMATEETESARRAVSSSKMGMFVRSGATANLGLRVGDRGLVKFELLET
jgi:hypothetical protein